MTETERVDRAKIEILGRRGILGVGLHLRKEKRIGMR
jgi:hypothetical protein